MHFAILEARTSSLCFADFGRQRGQDLQAADPNRVHSHVLNDEEVIDDIIAAACTSHSWRSELYDTEREVQPHTHRETHLLACSRAKIAERFQCSRAYETISSSNFGYSSR